MAKNAPRHAFGKANLEGVPPLLKFQVNHRPHDGGRRFHVRAVSPLGKTGSREQSCCKRHQHGKQPVTYLARINLFYLDIFGIYRKTHK